MNKFAVAAVAALSLLAACAQTPSPEEVAAKEAEIAAQREIAVRALYDTATEAVSGEAGPAALAPYVPELEDALAQAPQVDDAVDSPYPGMALLLVRYYNQSGRFEDALKMFDGQHSLDGYPEERAIALGGAKRWTEALAAWERALRRAELTDAERVRLWCGRAAALIGLGRPNEAELSLRSVLAVDPENKAAAAEMARLAPMRADAALGGVPVR